jgi:hypothetical protein
MNTAPMALTKTEVGELAGIKDIRDMWGAEGGPGYVGDYFILAGDMLGEPPVQLIRRDGKLALL